MLHVHPNVDNLFREIGAGMKSRSSGPCPTLAVTFINQLGDNKCPREKRYRNTYPSNFFFIFTQPLLENIKISPTSKGACTQSPVNTHHKVHTTGMPCCPHPGNMSNTLGQRSDNRGQEVIGGLIMWLKPPFSGSSLREGFSVRMRSGVSI